ncbi:MAG: hypothetical protein O9346_09775 [Leptospiraceae bacterium]|nr:hypothetical protein [Leptospiraceae bacterium]MCZ8346693.1 hypothetical protein [Leptospiraceae bacterium]
MTDQQNQPKDQLKVQAEQINIALESVNNEDQAKELINGRIQDAFLLKIKVDVENRAGMLMVLISMYKKRILEVYSLIGNSPLLRKIHTFEDYQQLSRDFVAVANAGGVDNSVSDMVGRAVYKSIVTSVIEASIPAWEKRDATNTINLLQQSFIKHVKVNRVKITAEVERISSVKFRYKNPMQGIVSPINPPLNEEEEAALKEDERELLPFEKLIDATVKSYSRELKCESILSPVSGVEFDDLVEGQEILFKLPYSSPEDKTTAKALDVVDKDGNLLPIVGKFITIVNGKNEYHILAEGPANTVLHAIEERPVRIATPKRAVKNKIDRSNAPANNMGLLVIAGAAIMILLVLILLLI